MTKILVMGQLIAFVIACTVLLSLDGFMFKSKTGLSKQNINPYHDYSGDSFSRDFPVLSKLARVEEALELSYEGKPLR